MSSIVRARDESSELDAAVVHAAHAEFVWASLFRLGVRPEDLPDMLQEVFIVVHRRKGSFDGSSKIRTWLYGICLGVARNYRRRAHRRCERLVGGAENELLGHADQRSRPDDPESELARAQARARLAQVLDELDETKRAVFVMFEIEGLSCDQIADTLGVPVGTVYSRLHTARKRFAAALRRLDASDASTTAHNRRAAGLHGRGGGT